MVAVDTESENNMTQTKWTPIEDRLPVKELEAYRKENAAHYKKWYDLEPYEIIPEFLVTVSEITGTRPTTSLFDGEDFFSDNGAHIDVIAWAMLPTKYEG